MENQGNLFTDHETADYENGDQGNLFTRDDTFFGVCQGLGEDLGFNPNWLRIALPVLAFFWPVATIAGYIVAGLFVLATRLVFPDPRRAAPTKTVEADEMVRDMPVALAA